jgi:hypothetical protein
MVPLPELPVLATSSLMGQMTDAELMPPRGLSLGSVDLWLLLPVLRMEVQRSSGGSKRSSEKQEVNASTCSPDLTPVLFYL